MVTPDPGRDRPVPPGVVEHSLRIAGLVRWATAGSPSEGWRATLYTLSATAALMRFWVRHRYCEGFRQVETDDMFGFWCDSHRTGTAA